MEKVKEITHKAKDAITPNHGNTSTTGTTGHSTHTGPHNSGAANAADPRVDSDRDGSRNLGASSHNTTTEGIGSTTGGIGSTTGGYNSSTNAGPHDSSLGNKVDPRVDSDRDGSRNLGASSHGHNTGTGLGSTTGGYSSSTNTGHHDSNLANKADPRVDSDRDGSRNLGAASHGNTTTSSSGIGAGVGDTRYPANTRSGPHDSNIANAADPRVDSDRDGSRNLGASSHGNTTGAGYGSTTGGYSSNTNAGHHDSNLANKADPRIDSDRDGSRNLGAASNTTGGYDSTHSSHTGPASNTAGPHKSNLLNKADPRVDSDLDNTGSRREL